MIDLHCHILPEIDDGAKNIDDSFALLRGEKAQGVNSIMFTPHFNAERGNLDKFLEKRNRSLKMLTEPDEFKEIGITAKVGAEVYFSVSLANGELDALCFAGTNYILIELPVEIKPGGLMYTLDNVINRGYTPIIAHVERYAYISKDPILLYDLILKGCLAHVNASAVLSRGKMSAIALKYIRWGIVQFVCSDCHSMKHRPPNLREAFSKIEKNLGRRYAAQLINNSERIFSGDAVDLSEVKKPRKIFGTWI